jgi:glycosyltransferase involved in cell wall biosynthesis
MDTAVTMAHQSQTKSKRIVFDLQACQTEGSARRGVGRYSSSLFNGFLQANHDWDIRAVVSDGLKHQVQFDRVPENRVSRIGELPAWDADRNYNGGVQDTLDSLALTVKLAPLKPDVVHVSHVFEGFRERVALPSAKHKAPGQVVSATLYDLIPLVFKEHYFRNDEFRRWYYSRIEWLRQADLLLAISESSRQDAINLLGLDPSRISTVYGGVEPHFKPAGDRGAVFARLAQRYGIGEKFVLYTGGDDHRKNISGAIRGFAALPPPARSGCKLVVVCAMEEAGRAWYLDIARQAGLAESEIVITGYVPEEELLGFYQSCDAFVFPSLYEGLGLPVLEAMACGAPVLGGDNSSIRELIGRKDALFDASSPDSIGAALAKVLLDRGFAADLRDYGPGRAAEFSWETTTSKSLQALDDATDRATHAGVQAAINGWIPKMRMAMVSPLPPCRSGIADYNAKFLPFLSRHFDIDLYVDSYQVADETLVSCFPVFDVAVLGKVAKNYDAILYEFGNSEFHCHMVDLLDQHPGVVGLHDAYLSGMFGYFDFYLGDTGRYAREMLSAHGPLARKFYAPLMRDPEPNGGTMVELPCTKRVLDKATGVVSHSPFNLQVARQFFPEGWSAPYRVIRQMVTLPCMPSHSSKSDARKRLGFAPNDVIIATFGHVVWTKWGDRLLTAFLASAAAGSANVHLVYAGELAKDEFGQKLNEDIFRSKIQDRIRITGFLSEDDYETYLRAADLAIQLRTKSRGGTPRGVLDCLGHALPVIVNNDASYRDYPDDVVLKIPSEPSQEDIARALDRLVQDQSMRHAIGTAARAYVAANHDPAHCAALYASAIYEFAEREKRTKADFNGALFAPNLAACRSPQAATDLASEWLQRIPPADFGRRRLIVDVTKNCRTDTEADIRQFVEEVVQSLYCSSRPGFDPIAVRLVDGELCVAWEWLGSLGLVLSQELGHEEPTQVTPRAGDVLLLLDGPRTDYARFGTVLAEAHDRNVPIFSVIGEFPSWTTEPGGRRTQVSGQWWQRTVRDAHRLICLSPVLAEEVHSYARAADPAIVPKLAVWQFEAHSESNSENRKIPRSSAGLLRIVLDDA